MRPTHRRSIACSQRSIGISARRRSPCSTLARTSRGGLEIDPAAFELPPATGVAVAAMRLRPPEERLPQAGCPRCQRTLLRPATTSSGSTGLN